MDPTTAQQQRFEHIASLLDPEHTLDSLRKAHDDVVNAIYRNIPRGMSSEDLDRRLCVQAKDASDASIPLLMEDARLSFYAPEDLQALLRDARGFSLETLSSANPNQSWDKVFALSTFYSVDSETIPVAAQNFRMFWRHNLAALGSVPHLMSLSTRFTLAGLTGDLVRQLDTMQARRNVLPKNVFPVILRSLLRHILTGRFNMKEDLEDARRIIFHKEKWIFDSIFDPRFMVAFSSYFKEDMRPGIRMDLVQIHDHFDTYSKIYPEVDLALERNRFDHDSLSSKLADIFIRVAGVAKGGSDREPLPFLLDILAFFQDVAAGLGLPPVSNPLETVL